MILCDYLSFQRIQKSWFGDAWFEPTPLLKQIIWNKLVDVDTFGVYNDEYVTVYRLGNYNRITGEKWYYEIGGYDRKVRITRE
jgi:hypothetical protein